MIFSSGMFISPRRNGGKCNWRSRHLLDGMKVREEALKAHDYSMKAWITVLLLTTLILSSCSYYPANEYSGSGYYGPPSYYPEPNGYPGSGYSAPPSYYPEPNGYPGSGYSAAPPSYYPEPNS